MKTAEQIVGMLVEDSVIDRVYWLESIGPMVRVIQTLCKCRLGVGMKALKHLE